MCGAGRAGPRCAGLMRGGPKRGGPARIATPNCTQKFCNYCKQHGHIITDCPTRPPRRQVQAFHAASSMTETPSVPVPEALTPEKVQQMVLSALSALGIQGKSHNISSPWFVDSGASNHMAGTSEHLTNVRTYNGTQNIQIADGNSLSITAVG